LCHFGLRNIVRPRWGGGLGASLANSAGPESQTRKGVICMEWLTPDFEEFECAGEVTMYAYHW